MPFMVPAVTALASDAVLLWLGSLQPLQSEFDTDDTHRTSSTAHAAPPFQVDPHTHHDRDTWVYHYVDAWTLPCAWIRLVLLAAPLLFHSYTGTAVGRHEWYRLFYGGTAVVAVAHMTALALLHPESVDALVPYWTSNGGDTDNNNNHNHSHNGAWFPFFHHHKAIDHTHELRRLWWMLLLTVGSVACHWILLWHVRSTAPSWRRRRHTHGTQFRNGSRTAWPTTVYFAVRAAAGEADHDEPALMHAMNEFVVDMQSRLQRAKTDWSGRLEHLGHKISNSSAHGTPSQGGPAATSTPKTLTAFRVLLQLFDYDDVLENNKLDTVFDQDDGHELTFYVPQLLSFLLHGALYSSPLLEEWLLQKCRRNVHFAHRCYWFLRAWCLSLGAQARNAPPGAAGGGSNNNPNNNSHGGGSPTHGTTAHTSNNSSSNNNNNGTTTNGMITVDSTSSLTNGMMNAATTGSVTTGSGLYPFLDEPAQSESSPHHANNNHNSSKGSTCRPPSEIRAFSVVDDKFLPEERAMIERLMMRVKECGEWPAQALEFGAPHNNNSHGAVGAGVTDMTTTTEATFLDHNSFDEGPDDDSHCGDGTHGQHGTDDSCSVVVSSSDTTLTRRGKGTHSSSTRNGGLRSAAASRRSDYHRSPSAMAAAAETGRVPVDPSTGFPSVRHFNALATQHEGYGFRSPDGLSVNSSPLKELFHGSETEFFDKTPQFLDALIFLAENLFLIPREERKATLHQQLRALECELLPSNSVYLPIGSNHHRVWRIVAEESIPISTKERVPCIIALEVIDYIPKRPERKSSSWNLLPKRQRAGTADSALTPQKSTGSNGASSAAAPLTSTSAEADGAPLDRLESDIVSQWRYGKRHPLRRVSLLDKVTTHVKVPFDKMKLQVRDHFNHLRETGSNEELIALSLGEYLVDPDHAPDLDRCKTFPINGTDIEAGVATDNEGLDDHSASGRELSRVNSTTSLASMGQWSTPPAVKRTISDKSSVFRNNFSDLRSRLENELPNKSRTSPLPYGSDQEDDPLERSSQSSAAQRPPRTTRRATGKGNTDGDEQSTATESVKSARPPPVVFRESWVSKQERVRSKSAYGDHPGWRLLPILIKANDDLRQEQLASQLIQRMAAILAREKVPVWLCPYEIIALTDRGGIIEAIPDTISLDSLKKNGPNTTLKEFFHSHYGEGTEELAGAHANFVESLAAYSMVSFILQLKDRHNGNILLDKWGHLIQIDFGFFFLSSPGKNAGFESAPFKLTRDFVEVLGGPDSHLFRTFRELCFKTFITLRRHCMEIILVVEMLKNGNEELQCFRGRPDDAIQQLRDRFRLDLNDRACKEYVNSLVDDSIENWRTDWYDRYQRYFVGVL